MGVMKVDITVNTCGLKAPLPLLKASREAMKLKRNQVMKIISTEKKSVDKFKMWADQTNSLQLLSQDVVKEGDQVYYIHYIKSLY